MAYPGNEYLSFEEIIRLERLDSTTFRSIKEPFAPGGSVGTGRAYGGHVYAQSAWAACQNLDAGFYLHHISGNFILPGLIHTRFVYEVTDIRNGRSYCTRLVKATQDPTRKAICFICICSFKIKESSPVDLQAESNLWSQYGVVLAGKKPTDFEEVPAMDLPFYWKRRRETGINEAFPGLQMQKVDMSAYNEGRHPLHRRQILFYRALGEIPIDQPNMHLCAHLYASDRNSLYIMTNLLSLGDLYTQMGSLSHTVVFHSEIEHLLFGPSQAPNGESGLVDSQNRWFAMEDYTTRFAGGRAMYHSRIWNDESVHVLTPFQEGMVRFTKGNEATADETSVLDERKKTWSVKSKV